MGSPRISRRGEHWSSSDGELWPISEDEAMEEVVEVEETTELWPESASEDNIPENKHCITLVTLMINILVNIMIYSDD